MGPGAAAGAGPQQHGDRGCVGEPPSKRQKVLGSDGRELAVGAGNEEMAALFPYYTDVNVQPVSSAAAGAPPLRFETSLNPASGAAVEAAVAHSLPSSAEDLLREDLVWEDTKQWVGFMWQSKEQCLQDLQIDEQTLKAWYMGTSRPRHITARLRHQIKAIREKQKQQQAHGDHHANPDVRPPAEPVAKENFAPDRELLKIQHAAALGGNTVQPGRSMSAIGCEACRGKHSKHTCDMARGIPVQPQQQQKHQQQQQRETQLKPQPAQPVLSRLAPAGILEQQKLHAIGASLGGKAAAAQPQGGGGVIVIDDDSSSAAAGKSKTARAGPTVCTAGAEPAACGGTRRAGKWEDGNEEGRVLTYRALWEQALREQVLSDQAQMKQVHRLNQSLREQASREQRLKEQVRRLHCLAEHRRHVVNSLKRKVAASEAASE